MALHSPPSKASEQKECSLADLGDVTLAFSGVQVDLGQELDLRHGLNEEQCLSKHRIELMGMASSTTSNATGRTGGGSWAEVPVKEGIRGGASGYLGCDGKLWLLETHGAS